MSKKLPTSRRTFVKGTAASAAIAPFFIGRSAKAGDAEFTLKVGTVAPKGTPWERLLGKFRKEMAKATEGRVKLKGFLGGVLGDELQMAAACSAGRLDFFGGSAGALAQGAGIPALEALEMPFLLNRKTGPKALSANRQMIHDILWENNLKLVMFSENGVRSIGSTFPIEKPQDLKGRKMRSQETKSHLAFWKQAGASPSAMGVTEVLSSLQTGIIEGFDNTALFTIAASWQSGIKYWTKTEHMYQGAVIVASRKVWEKLPQEIRDAMDLESDDIRKMEARGIRGVQGLEPQLEENFKTMGIEVVEPDPGPWRKLAHGVESDFKKRTTKQGVALLKALKAAT